MQDTKEAITVGKIEINNRPMRVQIYTFLERLNRVSNIIIESVPPGEPRDQVRDEIKGLILDINNWMKPRE